MTEYTARGQPYGVLGRRRVIGRRYDAGHQGRRSRSKKTDVVKIIRLLRWWRFCRARARPWPRAAVVLGG
jgi:hypothetical protein